MSSAFVGGYFIVWATREARIYTCVCVSILFQILFPHRLLQNIEQSSLGYSRSLLVVRQGTFDFKESNMLLFLKASLFLISSYSGNEWKHAVPRTEVIGWDMYESPSVTLFCPSDLVCIRLSILWLLIQFHPVIILLKIYKPAFLLIKHPCSIRAWVPMSFFFFPLSLFYFLIINSKLPGSSPLKDHNGQWAHGYLRRVVAYCEAEGCRMGLLQALSARFLQSREWSFLGEEFPSGSWHQQIVGVPGPWFPQY